MDQLHLLVTEKRYRKKEKTSGYGELYLSSYMCFTYVWPFLVIQPAAFLYSLKMKILSSASLHVFALNVSLAVL